MTISNAHLPKSDPSGNDLNLELAEDWHPQSPPDILPGEDPMEASPTLVRTWQDKETGATIYEGKINPNYLQPADRTPPATIPASSDTALQPTRSGSRGRRLPSA
jgi:hypothetical protein